MSAESTRDTLGIRLSNRALKIIRRNLIFPQKLIKEVDKSLVASGEFISQGACFWNRAVGRQWSEERRAKGKGQRAKGKDLLLFALCSLDSEREWLRNEELFKLQIRWQSGAAAQGRTL
jgi:hypothetical protein